MLRTILITGASSGIGAATAIAFANPNNRLILVSRKNREGLKKIEDEGRERGAEVLSILADVSDYESCKSLLTEANEHFGPIDLLINNAGISHIFPLYGAMSVPLVRLSTLQARVPLTVLQKLSLKN